MYPVVYICSALICGNICIVGIDVNNCRDIHWMGQAHCNTAGGCSCCGMFEIFTVCQAGVLKMNVTVNKPWQYKFPAKINCFACLIAITSFTNDGNQAILNSHASPESTSAGNDGRINKQFIQFHNNSPFI